MKQFGTILKFELASFIKNKVFTGITIFLVALIAVVMFFPRMMSAVDQEGEVEDRAKPIMLVSTGAEGGFFNPDAFATAFSDYNVQYTQDVAETIKEKVISGEAECAILVNSSVSYTYYVDNLSMYDMNTQIADEVMQTVYRMNAMVNNGLTEEQASKILSAQITHSEVSLGKDQMQNFFYTYIMIFALYMVILLYGQMIASNVASEKSSRAMELLVTSAKPTSMMFGKVIASCLAGLAQLVAVFGSALLFFNLNKSYWSNNEIVGSIFNMPVELFLYMLLFFVLGFFIYAFMYGAVGSTASKLEDINTSVMPVTLLFIIGFFVVVFSMTSGNADTTLMKVCSYIPFTSPMAMFTRIAMSTVAPVEIVISVAILIVSVLGVGLIASKIYRIGVLMYGTTPKISTVIRAMKKSR